VLKKAKNNWIGLVLGLWLVLGLVFELVLGLVPSSDFSFVKYRSNKQLFPNKTLYRMQRIYYMHNVVYIISGNF